MVKKGRRTAREYQGADVDQFYRKFAKFTEGRPMQGHQLAESDPEDLFQDRDFEDLSDKDSDWTGKERGTCSFELCGDPDEIDSQKSSLTRSTSASSKDGEEPKKKKAKTQQVGSRKAKSSVSTMADLESSAKLLDAQMFQRDREYFLELIEGQPLLLSRALQWAKVQQRAQAVQKAPQIPGCYTRLGFISQSFYRERLLELADGHKAGKFAELLGDMSREAPSQIVKLWLWATDWKAEEKITTEIRGIKEMREMAACRAKALGDRLHEVVWQENQVDIDWSGKPGTCGYFTLCFIDENDQVHHVLEAQHGCHWSHVGHIDGYKQPVPQELREHFTVDKRIHSNDDILEAKVIGMEGRLTIKLWELFPVEVCSQKIAFARLKKARAESLYNLKLFDEMPMPEHVKTLLIKGGNRSAAARQQCALTRYAHQNAPSRVKDGPVAAQSKARAKPIADRSRPLRQLAAAIDDDKAAASVLQAASPTPVHEAQDAAAAEAPAPTPDEMPPIEDQKKSDAVAEGQQEQEQETELPKCVKVSRENIKTKL